MHHGRMGIWEGQIEEMGSSTDLILCNISITAESAGVIWVHLRVLYSTFV